MPTLNDIAQGLNRGFVTGLLGMPVDVANAVLSPLGIQKPVMGSEWIGDKLQSMGLLGARPESTAGLLSEFAGGLINPGAPAAGAMKLAALAKSSPALAAMLVARAKINPAELGLLGDFATTTPGRIINKTKANQGYSVNLVTGETPTEGLMVGQYRNTDPRNVVTDKLTTRTLADFANANEGQLLKDDRFLGTWFNKDDGKYYIDVSRKFDPSNKRLATKTGERTGQLKGYDVGKGDEFPIGNWEDFVRSPEFQARLDQMAMEGRAYLDNFPAAQWWDMHGGPFERVYGSQNMPQVAGFTASTAPNAAPRENLQTMSEYMRRQIKGEPILQPEWIVPEGMMTRQPGKQIGMETSRARNLERSSEGLLGELRQDKVREEAQAMMGDPNAAVFDRHWARLAEDPSRGIYTASSEGVVEPGKQYLTLKDSVAEAAARAGRSLRDYSADVWTGIREHIKNNSELFGQRFRGSAITGDSKSYADHFEDLIRDKAKHLGITVSEMEERLRKGDANLMSLVLGTPLGYAVYRSYVSGEVPSPEQ